MTNSDSSTFSRRVDFEHNQVDKTLYFLAYNQHWPILRRAALKSAPKCFRTLTLAGLICSLSGCLDADITTRVNDDKTVTVTSVMEVTRQLYDMSRSQDSKEICPADQIEVGKEKAVCREEWTSELGSLASGRQKGSSQGLGDFTASATEVSSGVIRVSFPLQKLKDNAQASVTKTSDAGKKGELASSMQQMMLAAFAGHSISLTVEGNEIVETSGTRSEDGKSASLVIPLVDLFESNTDQLPTEFTADVRVRSCTLWVFCG